MGWKSGKPREELDWTFFPNKEIEAGYLLSPVGGGAGKMATTSLFSFRQRSNPHYHVTNCWDVFSKTHHSLTPDCKVAPGPATAFGATLQT